MNTNTVSKTFVAVIVAAMVAVSPATASVEQEAKARALKAEEALNEQLAITYFDDSAMTDVEVDAVADELKQRLNIK